MTGEVIFSYTRAQAIADGVLMDVSELAQESGFRFPVAVTAGVWAECVAVPDGVEGQDETGRLWDVLRGHPRSNSNFPLVLVSSEVPGVGG